MPGNFFSDISGIAQSVQDDAIFILRETQLMQSLVTVFTDMTGLNPRKGYRYNGGTAQTVAESDDLVSKALTPALDQTLTPAEIGLDYLISDSRAESEAPESIMNDAALELGAAARDKVEYDLSADMASLTGGTIGAAGTVITWGYLAAAIARARVVNKSKTIPLSAVVHEYQWSVLAKSATVAGATVAATAPGFQEEITRSGYVATFMGVRLYSVTVSPDSSDDFTGAVFPKNALAMDWRRPIRIEGQRDASRRATELVMSGVYAHGVWRPDRGIKMIFDAAAPSS